MPSRVVQCETRDYCVVLPGCNLDLSVVLGAQGNLEQRLLQKLSGLVRDGNMGLIIKLLHGPMLLDKQAQSAEGRLTDARVDGRMRTDASKGNGKRGIRLSPSDLDFGSLAGCLFGELRVGQELRQLVLHDG